MEVFLVFVFVVILSTLILSAIVGDVALTRDIGTQSAGLF
jgi:hypothetical protein